MITIKDLLDRHKDVKVDHVLWMMARNLLVADWDNELFSNPAKCHLFESEEAKRSFINKRKSTVPSDLLFTDVHELRVGNQYVHGDSRWTVFSLDAASKTVMVEIRASDGGKRLDHYSYANLSVQVKLGILRQVNDVDEASTHRNYLKSYSPDVVARANERMNIVVQLEERKLRPGEAAALLGVTTETLRSYRKRYQKEQAKSGCGYYGLLDDTGRRGNHDQRVPDKTEELIQEFIEKDYKTATVKNVSDVHAAFLTKCKEVGADVVSLETFRRRVQNKPAHKTALPRQGIKVATDLRPGLDPSVDISDPHGYRAFQRAHIDHTLIDLATLRELSNEEQKLYKKKKRKTFIEFG